MNFSDSIQDVLTSLQAWLFSSAATLPAEMITTLSELSSAPSPVDRIVKVGEFLYARRSEINTSGKEQCAQLIAIATNSGWHGLQTEGRGTKIVKAMCRDVGEEPPVGGWPDPSEDPEPKAEYVPEPPAEDPPA